ncbi:12526_t:CDS:2 [Acaulospora colombiana]|uniref:12526_t:CDS:1 n=1 Tax=Acaulospora colombiana TaxID=27376 RepID=A0ACA9KL53_9GLOM|nr:12526_t:CDS:2 [Acaulospora colombiana]
MEIHKTMPSTTYSNNIYQTSFSSNNIQPYQYQTINFIQQKYHHHKLFPVKNVLDASMFPVSQRKNLTPKNSEIAKKTTEFTNNPDFASKVLINNSTSSRPASNSTANMSRHHRKMFESITKNCVVSRDCVDSKNPLVPTNRPDSKNQRPTPTKNHKNPTVCANARNDPSLSKNFESNSVYVLKLAKNKFSVTTTRRLKKDEFILRYIGDKPSTDNFLQLKQEYSDLDVYFDRFIENRGVILDGNMYAPFIRRCDTPNCYIQVTREGNKKDNNNNNSCKSHDDENLIYKVEIFALCDIKSGVELKLGLNLTENSDLTSFTLQNRPQSTASSNLRHSLQSPQDSFPMSIQITSEERHHHNKFQNLITAIQLLETSVVNYCIEHAPDPITSPAEKLTETIIMLFGLPQSMFSRVHTIILTCLRESIGIDQCQTCLLNAFRLFLEWNTTSDGSGEVNMNTSTLIHGSTSSSHTPRNHRRQHSSRSPKISLFEKFVTCFLLSIKGTFDVIPIPTFMWSERLSISKYKLVRWELECLKAIRFEVVITSTLYFCWLGKLCDDLEV